MSQMQRSTFDTGLATEVTLEAVAGLVTLPYDYIAATYAPASSETYTFKTGGSGGTTVATVNIVYTDSTKSVLTSVTKT